MKNDETYNFNELTEFLSKEIPESEFIPPTFLEIAKKPHYEEIWSEIYAFFFRAKAEHGLGSLFINSLTELILEKTGKSYSFSKDFDVSTEVSTNTGKRVDIIIQDENQGIVIESKVHHVLNNDLEEYWDTIRSKEKIGVILALIEYSVDEIRRKGNIKSDNVEFIGVPHLSFLDKVMENLISHRENAHPKYLMFLEDFYQNVKNVTKPMDVEVLNFYFENSEKVNQIEEIKTKYNDFIKERIKAVVTPEDDDFELPTLRNNHYQHLKSKSLKQYKDNLLLTIYYGDLTNGKQHITIIVEVKGKELKDNNIFFKEVDTLWQGKYKKIKHSDKFEKYGHYIYEIIPIKLNEINQLDLNLREKLKDSEIIEVYRKMERKLLNR